MGEKRRGADPKRNCRVVFEGMKNRRRNRGKKIGQPWDRGGEDNLQLGKSLSTKKGV